MSILGGALELVLMQVLGLGVKLLLGSKLKLWVGLFQLKRQWWALRGSEVTLWLWMGHWELYWWMVLEDVGW